MKLVPYKSIFITLVISLIALAVHKIVLLFFFPKEFEQNLIYSLPKLYAFFCFSTVVILLILIKINQKSIDNVGFVFMFLTSLKMLFAYFFMQPILNSLNKFAFSEKINFFAVFILFLTIETVVTIRILNNKQ
jgi:hypothetical protein